MVIPKTHYLLYFVSLVFLCDVLGQENAGSSVAPALIECYNNSRYLDRESRPPATINVLIDLIRKVENGPSVQDMKEYATEFIHRFRQDGIVRTYSSASQYSIPYSPILMQAYKNKILLKKLVPGSARLFPNETLNGLELCSLHFMLSNSIDRTQRGDESVVCNRLSRYQRRFRRNIEKDVEIFDPRHSKISKGNIENADGENSDDPPVEDPLSDGNNPSDGEVEPIARSLSRNIEESSCPVEEGVVYTKWGSIQAGTVIAGIAAGLSQQSINTNNGYTIDNRYATTLAGDLSEVALLQGVKTANIVVGAKGGWNSTVVPRWYFVEKTTNLEMTDAEIRAGLDGLILGTNVQSWYSSYPSLKLSQLLDMYYSPRGVLDNSIRACNRNSLLTTVAPESDLVNQAVGFSFELDDYATLPGTLSPEGVQAFSNSATSDFLTYAPQFNDVSCLSEGDTVQRASSDVIIVLDTQWSYTIIQNAISYLLDNIDVNIYDGSNYTIINGYDGAVIVNTSNSIVDFYEYYNLTVHNNFTSGFEFRTAFNEVEKIARARLDNATITQSSLGQSLVALFIPYTQTISDSDKTWISERKEVFKSYIPDLKLLVLGRGSVSSYNDLVYSSSSDIFTLSESTSDTTALTDSIKSVVSRIKEIPRSIINPKCGSNWSGTDSSNYFYQYVEPANVNYYKISPNYLFGDGTRTLKIKGVSSQNTFTICNSRTVSRPSQNNTSSDSGVTCETLTSTNELTKSLDNSCGDYSTISSCPPYYFSIQLSSTTRSFQCTDSNCRFPDNAKIQISHEGFTCRSGSSKLNWTIGVFLVVILNFFT